LFNLTEAESVVARSVQRGHGLHPVADELSVSLATVRAHLQHVFEKTGTHRQAELVRLLWNIQLLADTPAHPRRPSQFVRMNQPPPVRRIFQRTNAV
jgi:DNA-binding CsgD family transcriptional regulator